MFSLQQEHQVQQNCWSATFETLDPWAHLVIIRELQEPLDTTWGVLCTLAHVALEEDILYIYI